MSIEPFHALSNVPARPAKQVLPKPGKKPLIRLYMDEWVTALALLSGNGLIIGGAITINVVGHHYDKEVPPGLWSYCFWGVTGWTALAFWCLWRHRWYKRHPTAAALVTAASVAYGAYRLYEHEQKKQAQRIGDAVAANLKPDWHDQVNWAGARDWVPPHQHIQDLRQWDR